MRKGVIGSIPINSNRLTNEDSRSRSRLNSWRDNKFYSIAKESDMIIWVHINERQCCIEEPDLGESPPIYKEQDKKLAKENNIDCCPICNIEKLKSKKYCSVKCSAKSREKIDWDTIDLLEEIKNKSNGQIAKELNISEAVIRKRLKRLFTHNSIVEYQAVNLGVLGAGPSE